MNRKIKIIVGIAIWGVILCPVVAALRIILGNVE